MYLVKPAPEFEQSFKDGLEEISDPLEKEAWVYLGPDYPDYFKIPFEEYSQRLRRFEHSPPQHFVKGSTYWAIDEGQVIGRIGIRHELNDFLRTIGGHIGYIVRPSRRRKGVATKMLNPCS